MNRYVGRFEGAAYVLLRVSLGFLYWSHGPRWLFGAFTDSGPVPLASLRGVAGMLEITLGPLIAIGLCAPWAAFIASGEMAYAYLFVHVPRGSWMPIVNGGEITVALCFGFLYIATRGAGSFSIDSWYRSGVPQSGSTTDPVEERLCNMFAARLLMPSRSSLEFWGRQQKTPEAVRHFAGCFHVSLQAAASCAVGTRMVEHISFWEREPWIMKRWQRGIPLARSWQAQIGGIVSLLSYAAQGRDEAIEPLPFQDVVAHASLNNPFSALVVLRHGRVASGCLPDAPTKPQSRPLVQSCLPGFNWLV